MKMEEENLSELEEDSDDEEEDDSVGFQTLLKKLLSPDNETCQVAKDACDKIFSPDAEFSYDNISAEQRASFLFSTVKNEQFNFEHRKRALDVLRRLFRDKWTDIWPSWTAETEATFCNEVLLCTQNEMNEALRKRYCKLVSEMARNALDDEAVQVWQETESDQNIWQRLDDGGFPFQIWQGVLFKFLFNCAQSPEARLKQVALRIFENVPEIFGRQQHKYLNMIRDMFSATLQFTDANDENGSTVVRYQAVKAATSFICDSKDDRRTVRVMQSLIPHLLRVCAYSIEKEDDVTCLQRLTDVALTVPEVLCNHLPDLCNMCIKTLSDVGKTSKFREAALDVVEVIEVMALSDRRAMVRKRCASFVPQLLKQCLILMCDLEDNREWYKADDVNVDDDVDNATVGETSLDRLAIALGGETVLQPCLRLTSALMRSDDWKFRHAGLTALSTTIGEGCQEQTKAVLGAIVDSILPFSLDPHPRIRYAACYALHQMSRIFAPKFQKNFHQKVIPALLDTLDDHLAHQRVAARAIAALVSFSEDAPKPIMTLYLDPITRKLLWVLEQAANQLVVTGKKLVSGKLVTTVIVVSDSTKADFAVYYDRVVMPCLKYILLHAAQPELRGWAIECAILIGLAIEKEKIIANEITELLLKTQSEFWTMSAWVRVCTILGPDYVQYLPSAMPAIMKVASFKPEVVLEWEPTKRSQYEEDDDWQFLDSERIGMIGIKKTASLMEKAAACQTLVTYARELKGGFGEYVEQTTRLMVPLLNFYFHEGLRLRTTAAEAMPELLEAVKVKGAEFVADMWRLISKDLLKATGNDDFDDRFAMMSYLAKCIECLGAGYQTNDDLKEVIDVLEHHLDKHNRDWQRVEGDEFWEDDGDDRSVPYSTPPKKDPVRTNRTAGWTAVSSDIDGEDEEEDLSEKDDEDTLLLRSVFHVLHATFRTHKEAVVPHFEKLLPHLVKLLEPNRPYPDYLWALRIFENLIEFGGLASLKYQQYSLRPMIEALEHRQPELRRAGAHGIGIMGMYGGNGYAQACAEAIPCLVGAWDEPYGGWNRAASENAVAAVGKILKYNNSMIDVGAVLPMFISWLPVWEDKEECPHVYGYLCDLIESNNPVAMGVNGANVPHLIAIIVDAFRLDAMEEETEKNAASGRMRKILKDVQADEPVFQDCLAVLNEVQKSTLQKELAVQ